MSVTDYEVVAPEAVDPPSAPAPLATPDHDHSVCERIAWTIAADLASDLRRSYPVSNRPMRRDAHPKHHGVLQATFEIDRDVPPELRHGVFAKPGHTFQAWVRFSNAFKVRPDLNRDARGFAIKLLGVTGTLSPHADRTGSPQTEPTRADLAGGMAAGGAATGGAHTQDFLMVTHDAFFARDAADFVDFPSAIVGRTGSLQMFVPLLRYFFGVWPPRWRGMRALCRSNCWTSNPMYRHFFSQVPSRLGSGSHVKFIKFGVRPNQGPSLWEWLVLAWRVSCFQFGVRPARWNSFLRDALFARAVRSRTSFDFLVQVQTDPQRMPVDDATKRWSSSWWPWSRWSGFVKVATVHLEHRQLEPATIADRMRFGEQLSFTPWHTLMDHEPAGSISCARRIIYEAISSLRHDTNHRLRREPHVCESPAAYLKSIEL
jgi:hypothetical protein